jgi:hypothetical protein
VCTQALISDIEERPVQDKAAMHAVFDKIIRDAGLQAWVDHTARQQRSVPRLCTSSSLHAPARTDTKMPHRPRCRLQLLDNMYDCAAQEQVELQAALAACFPLASFRQLMDDFSDLVQQQLGPTKLQVRALLPRRPAGCCAASQQSAQGARACTWGAGPGP